MGRELTRMEPAVEIQREYCAETASRYDTMHMHEGADDPAGGSLILSVLRSLEIRSLLDMGSATVRGLKDFAAGLPGALVYRAEPVSRLVRHGVAARNARRFRCCKLPERHCRFATPASTR